MSLGTTALLGAITGLTILIGLPLARVRGISPSFKGFLNATANGILVFLLWDVLTKANEPIQKALHAGHPANLALLLVIFLGGISAGLLTCVYFNAKLGLRFGPGAAAASGVGVRGLPAGRSLALMIAIGLGLHNFSEGLAIGESAATGAISFAGVLVIGFSLHNITEGFGIAAPMAADDTTPSWGFPSPRRPDLWRSDVRRDGARVHRHLDVPVRAVPYRGSGCTHLRHRRDVQRRAPHEPAGAGGGGDTARVCRWVLDRPAADLPGRMKA